MAKRRKLTGFSRLMLALLVIIPGAFVGASYYNGEDPVAKFKELVGWEEARSTRSSTSRQSGNSDNSTRGSLPADDRQAGANYDNTERDELITRIAVLEERLARCQAQDVE
ncbi:MAG: hypothetical protein AAF741_19610 [Bacteroidota bacterium]